MSRKSMGTGFPTIRQFVSIPERQGDKCNLSGLPITPQKCSLDHKNPRSMGGTDDIENLQLVLPVINRAKGTMTQDQFVAMCHAVARHVDDSCDETWIEWTGR